MKYLLIFGACLALLASLAPSNPPATQVAAAEAPKLLCDASKAMQAKRLAMIGKLQRMRVILKIDTPGTTPRVYVLPMFTGATWDQKTTFMSTVYAWANDCKPGEMIRIFDALTNKSLGSFTPETGLNL